MAASIIKVTFPLLSQRKKNCYDVTFLKGGSYQCKRQPENLYFDQQLDQAFLWISCWDDNQISLGILTCVKNCSFKSKKLLSTILEPLLHRDFIYNNFFTNPDGNFTCLSTYITREFRTKLEKDLNKSQKVKMKVNLCRLKSAHVKSETDVSNWSTNSILPSLKTTQSDKRKATIISERNKLPYFTSTHKYLLLDGRIDQKDGDVVNNRIDNKITPFCKSSLAEHAKPLNKTVHRQSYYPTTSRKTNRDNMFQSPSRCTSLHRNKTQLYPASKSGPVSPRLMKASDVVYREYNIFKTFPESMKTKKRYMQNKISENIEERKMYRSSAFLTLNEFNRKEKVYTNNYETEVFQVFSWFSTWKEYQQEQFLQNLLKLLTPTQLYFMYASIMIRLYRDFISELPETIAFQIVKYFNPKQIQVCAKVCRKWKFICTHDAVWQEICKRKNIKISRGSLSCMAIYYNHKSIKTNWTEGRYHISEMFQHNQSSITSLDFNGIIVATGCIDKCIRIWRFDQKRPLIILEGHQRTIWSVLFISSNLLLSCSNDQTIKFWNVNTGKCIRTIVGHEGAVWCLHARKEIFVSGSSDRSAKVWQLRSCAVLRSFNNHPGGVYSVALSDNEERLYTGSVDKSVRVWDIISSELLICLQIGDQNTPSAPVACLSYDKGYLLCGCGTEMQLLDCWTLDWFEIFNEIHEEKVECVQLNIQSEDRGYDTMILLKGRIVTCGKDGKVKIWDLMRRKLMATLALLEETVNFLKFDEVKIACACQDGCVRMINFN